MSDETRVELDREAYHPGYGTGGVPWILMVFYLSFLVFFAWYVLEYQLPNYLDQQSVQAVDGARGTVVDGTE